ncbi:Extracellular metalloproteinase 1 [Paramyrothecium foliicola]|nr:Extracellular metalloproteinase 1 [Paramyrothecium foliicola]
MALGHGQGLSNWPWARLALNSQPWDYIGTRGHPCVPMPLSIGRITFADHQVNMYSATLLSLLGATLPFSVSAGRTNPTDFRLKASPGYVKAASVASDPSLKLLKRGDYVETATEVVQQLAPNATYRLVEDHYVGTNGVAHLHFQQTAHGVDIKNAVFDVNIAKDGSVFSYSNAFFSGEVPDKASSQKRAVLNPQRALETASQVLNLSISGGSIKDAGSDGEYYTFRGITGAVETPEARMVYVVKPDGELGLVWAVKTRSVDDYLVAYVDATTESDPEIFGVVDYINHAGYEVYPWGINDPTEGKRVYVDNLADPVASKSGWHKYPGMPRGYEDRTIGNNIDSGSVPTALVIFGHNKKGNFSFPYVPDAKPAADSAAAAATQMFYITNMCHDLYYLLGWTPAAGNLQEINHGEGGIEGDSLIVRTLHYSEKNNGQFEQSIDGQRSYLTMRLFDKTTPMRDGSFDNGFLIHEYTHGLSGRLTGGPLNANCLNSWEADGMAEGWSDLFAAAIMLKPNETRETATYGFAAWPLNLTATEAKPKTARLVLYSTDMTVNPWTYSKVNSLGRVHEVGTAWATMLYDVMWNLIDKHGRTNATFPTLVDGIPTDGKYLTLKLLVDAMALQPCNPTFVQARDAILDADLAVTGGANRCEIWKGFAKRGLGEGAVFAESDRVDDFVVPSDC